MPQSPNIGALAADLSKARAVFKAAVKDAENPFFKSQYLTLAGCYDAIVESLGKHGLAVVQTTDVAESGALRLVSTLLHSSGEWISGVYPVNPVKNDPQGLGSAMTYARRYALMGLVGIAAESEDDDGEQASGKPKVTSRGAAAQRIPSWSDDQKAEIGKIFADIYELPTGEARVKALRDKMKYDAPSDVIDAAANLLRELEADNHEVNKENK